jgi:hypothetical protein
MVVRRLAPPALTALAAQAQPPAALARPEGATAAAPRCRKSRHNLLRVAEKVCAGDMMMVASLSAAQAAELNYLRGPCESYSDVIIRVARGRAYAPLLS